MKIKKVIACLLACVVLTVNLSAFCYAASEDPAPGETAAENSTPPAGNENPEDTGKETTDTASTLPEGFTLGSEIVLPEGVTIGEDGKVSITPENIALIMQMLMGAGDSGDGETDSGTDTETEPEAEPETEIVSIGTVDVRSDTWLHLRTGPGMDHKIIGHLLRGAEVEVVGESGDWYQVVVPETAGYVHKNYLDVAEREITVIPPAGTDSEADGGDAPAGELDEQTLMMLLLLMMGNMNNMEPAEPPSAALTPDGNMTLVDDYAQNNEDGSGKQFITLVTKAGNTFYLVIDRDDEGEQNVHFMNLVDERDLLSLMDEKEAEKYTPSTEQEKPAETTPPQETGGEAERSDTETPEKPASKMNLAPILLLVLALLGGGGFLAYTKLIKGKGKKTEAKPDPDADYTYDDEEDYGLLEDDGLDGEDGDADFDAEDDEPV